MESDHHTFKFEEIDRTGASGLFSFTKFDSTIKVIDDNIHIGTLKVSLDEIHSIRVTPGPFMGLVFSTYTKGKWFSYKQTPFQFSASKENQKTLKELLDFLRQKGLFVKLGLIRRVLNIVLFVSLVFLYFSDSTWSLQIMFLLFFFMLEAPSLIFLLTKDRWLFGYRK